MLIFILLLLFFICQCSSFTFSFQHHPSHLHGLSLSFYTHFVLSAQPITEWFVTLSFSTILFSSYHKGYGFEWAFFTHRRFLPYTPSQHLWHSLLLSRLRWELAVILWNLQGFILIIETQARPICLLIHSNPQSFIHLQFVFIHVNNWKVLLVVKTLIRSAATLFSSDRNIKQQTK